MALCASATSEVFSNRDRLATPGGADVGVSQVTMPIDEYLRSLFHRGDACRLPSGRLMPVNVAYSAHRDIIEIPAPVALIADKQ